MVYWSHIHFNSTVEKDIFKTKIPCSKFILIVKKPSIAIQNSIVIIFFIFYIINTQYIIKSLIHTSMIWLTGNWCEKNSKSMYTEYIAKNWIFVVKNLISMTKKKEIR